MAMTQQRTNTELSILSLGWGVQSFAIAAMMALDELPRADFLIHADTQHERSGTYDFARRWAPWLGERGLNVVTVQGSRTEVVVESWSNSVMIPAFTVNTNPLTGETWREWDPHLRDYIEHSSPSNLHGQIKRQCTHDWKIAPIRRFIRAELERRGVALSPGIVESWQGISLDEFERMRDSDVQYITNVYPLIDQRISRADCVDWLQRRGIEVPPKSSCTFCPFRSISSWKELKREGGPDWQEALTVDASIRDRRPKAALYVHPYRKPLEDAVRIPEDEGAEQLGLELGLEQPCDGGYCYV